MVSDRALPRLSCKGINKRRKKIKSRHRSRLDGDDKIGVLTTYNAVTLAGWTEHDPTGTFARLL